MGVPPAASWKGPSTDSSAGCASRGLVLVLILGRGRERPLRACRILGAGDAGGGGEGLEHLDCGGSGELKHAGAAEDPGGAAGRQDTAVGGDLAGGAWPAPGDYPRDAELRASAQDAREPCRVRAVDRDDGDDRQALVGAGSAVAADAVGSGCLNHAVPSGELSLRARRARLRPRRRPVPGCRPGVRPGACEQPCGTRAAQDDLGLVAGPLGEEGDGHGPDRGVAARPGEAEARCGRQVEGDFLTMATAALTAWADSPARGGT